MKHGRATRPAPSLAVMMRARADQEGDRTAYTFLTDDHAEVRLSYRDLARRATTIAAELGRTMARGERAMLLYPTGPEFVAAFWGCVCAGIVAVPVPEPLLQRHLVRVRNIAADAGATVMLTSSRSLAEIQTRLGDPAALRWLATDTIPEAVVTRWPEPPDDEHAAFLQYTSGSTGQPRGVIVSHGNLLANGEMIRRFLSANESTVFVSWLPLFHDMGLIGIMIESLYCGGHAVLMSPFSFLRRPAQWLEAITRFRANVSGGPDFGYALCARRVTREQCAAVDLSSWDIAFNGAEPVRPGTLRTFADRFAPFGFREEAFRPCYGLAEATVFVSGGSAPTGPRLAELDAAAFEQRTVAPASGAPATISVSCGPVAYGDQSVRIVDPETCAECGPDRVGEIWVGGSHVASGYWNNREETSRTFAAHLADTDEGPFLRTGDLGFLRDGELHIAGRLKDLIVVDGANHYPQDIEQTVEGCHVAIRRGGTAAFSVQREGGEEQIVIIAELNEPAAGDAASEGAAIVEAVRGAVSSEHGVRLADVRLVRPHTIPKTSSGKIERHTCRREYLTQSSPAPA